MCETHSHEGQHLRKRNDVTTLFAIMGVCAVAWLVLGWLRLVWFRTKALRVVTQDLAYNAAVPGFQGAVFNAVTRQVRTNAGNEYDAAIAFMLVQLGSLSTPLDEKATAFTMDKLQLIRVIVDSSNHGSELVREFLLLRPS